MDDDTRDQIANILRRAAGLPAREHPLGPWYRDEAGVPSIHNAVHLIIVKSFGGGVFGERPRAVENDLDNVLRTVRALKSQLAALPEEVRSAVNRAGCPWWREVREAEEHEDEGRFLAALDAPHPAREEWTVPASLAALERLGAALVPVTERAIPIVPLNSTTGMTGLLLRSHRRSGNHIRFG